MYGKQYIVARSAQRIPESYAIHQLSDWFVGVARDLEVRRVELAANRALLLIGHPLDLWGGVERLQTTGDTTAIYDIVGSYIALIQTANGVELQLDAAGSLPAVYAPEHGLVAANPQLIHECADDPELIAAFPIEKDAYFPFGLTPKRNVSRLLPNHRLALDTMTTSRHWPVKLPEGAYSPEENVAFIAQRIQELLADVSAREDISLPLTAGYDSRALLACLPQHNRRISSFTSILDRDAQDDARLAVKLAAAAGIPYHAAPYQAPTLEERRAWLDSTGHCVGGRASYNFKTVAAETADRVLCYGLAGEVGRAFYGSRMTDSTKLTAELLLQKLALPVHSSSVQAASRWLAGLRDFNTLQILDLLYIEVRLGCWGGPQLIAAGPCNYHLVPFNQRAIFERALDVPYKLRRRDFIPASIVRRQSPTLAAFPYNPGKRTLRKRITGLIGRVIRNVQARRAA